MFLMFTTETGCVLSGSIFWMFIVIIDDFGDWFTGLHYCPSFKLLIFASQSILSEQISYFILGCLHFTFPIKSFANNFDAQKSPKTLGN